LKKNSNDDFESNFEYIRVILMDCERPSTRSDSAGCQGTGYTAFQFGGGATGSTPVMMSGVVVEEAAGASEVAVGV
jgi:hypothetical protein